MVLTKRHSYKVPKDRKAQKPGGVISSDEAEVTGFIEKAAGGDFEAFGELYNIYLDRIYRYVFYQVKDKMTAEDLIEEIFVKAWKAIGSYRGKGQFSSWLYRIAHNYLVDYFRKSKKRRTLEIERVAFVASDEQDFEKRATRQELLEAISCLRDNQRQVIILKFIEGLDNREIAQIMGKSQGAIRILQMRALAILQKILSSEE
jgi:RNA polymerase sigma-70 factor (ECF subfamily)